MPGVPRDRRARRRSAPLESGTLRAGAAWWPAAIQRSGGGRSGHLPAPAAAVAATAAADRVGSIHDRRADALVVAVVATTVTAAAAPGATAELTRTGRRRDRLSRNDLGGRDWGGGMPGHQCRNCRRERGAPAIDGRPPAGPLGRA
jgi:hypothetical protein